MAKIIFFPIDIGLAHVVRSAAIAQALKKLGHQVYFGLPKSRQSLLQDTQLNFVDIPTTSKIEGVNAVNNFKDPQFQLHQAKQEYQVIQSIQPDAIVVDFRLSPLGIGLAKGIKSFFLTSGAATPYKAYLPNPGFSTPLFNLTKPLINHFVTQAKYDFMAPIVHTANAFGANLTLRQALSKPTYLALEPKTYFPPPLSHHFDLQFVGYVRWSGFDSQPPDWFDQLNQSKPIVYVSFGGTGFSKHKLITLSEALIDQGLQVLVSSGSHADPSDFPVRKNLYVEKYLPGLAASRIADLVICHGGQGTLFDAVIAGTPTLSLPFNPDQIAHSSRFRELGLGDFIWQPSPLDIISALKLSWEKLEQVAKHTPVSVITQKAQKMLSRVKQFQPAITQFQTQIHPQQSIQRTAGLIASSI